MTDDERRAEDESLREWARSILGITVFGAANGEMLFMAKIAHRLLDLLPPADDGEPVTADWLRAVGGYQAGDGTVTVGGRDLAVVFYPPGVYGRSGRLCLWTQKECVVAEVISTRGLVRRLCSALGITLTEPTP